MRCGDRVPLPPYMDFECVTELPAAIGVESEFRLICGSSPCSRQFNLADIHTPLGEAGERIYDSLLDSRERSTFEFVSFCHGIGGYSTHSLGN